MSGWASITRHPPTSTCPWTFCQTSQSTSETSTSLDQLLLKSSHECLLVENPKNHFPYLTNYPWEEATGLLQILQNFSNSRISHRLISSLDSCTAQYSQLILWSRRNQALICFLIHPNKQWGQNQDLALCLRKDNLHLMVLWAMKTIKASVLGRSSSKSSRTGSKSWTFTIFSARTLRESSLAQLSRGARGTWNQFRALNSNLPVRGSHRWPGPRRTSTLKSLLIEK